MLSVPCTEDYVLCVLGFVSQMQEIVAPTQHTRRMCNLAATQWHVNSTLNWKAQKKGNYIATAFEMSQLKSICFI